MYARHDGLGLNADLCFDGNKLPLFSMKPTPGR